MQEMQQMLVPEGVMTLLVTAAVIAAREWRRVQLAREKRREREQELLAEMVAEVAQGSQGVQVHRGGTGVWSLTSTGSAGEPRRDMSAGRAARVDGRAVAARRRR
ncbi:hypothetical protein OHA09_36040 [Streptomyces longwoodensis]|uniref:hypothetical protein n=1 Tax=Streptomyces longwoodensis TaxID=68231 RepID=UPI002E81E199|nr:hypothetical protein [Streptomyces longwoodensis]WUC55755.1 hypothetical protein OHA09_00935 [Streptomyces longwoodensis]WUC62126.1 hypothetical protein OHA09_36040 [Streptomyces longwoodensis]